MLSQKLYNIIFLYCRHKQRPLFFCCIISKLRLGDFWWIPILHKIFNLICLCSDTRDGFCDFIINSTRFLAFKMQYFPLDMLNLGFAWLWRYTTDLCFCQSANVLHHWSGIPNSRLTLKINSFREQLNNACSTLNLINLVDSGGKWCAH